MATIEYICQYMPNGGVYWLLSEEETPVARLSPHHSMFDMLLESMHHKGQSLETENNDEETQKYEFDAAYFAQMLQAAREDGELRDQAKKWWNKKLSLPKGTKLRACGDSG